MSTTQNADDVNRLLGPEDFSLVLGGPLFQLLVRSRLATPALDLLRRRVIFISLFAWLPLLILAISMAPRGPGSACRFYMTWRCTPAFWLPCRC